MAEKEYIEKQALVDDIESAMKESGMGYVVGQTMKRYIKRVPAADVAPVVHAEWDENEYAFCNVCMECGLVIDRTCIKYNSGKLNYCPNCGARMDGGKHGQA